MDRMEQYGQYACATLQQMHCKWEFLIDIDEC